MPYVQCPLCEEETHLRVQGDPAEWETKHIRQRSDTGMPLLVCSGCWETLQPGERLVLRAPPAELAAILPVGTEGTVESVAGDAFVAVFGQTQVVIDRSAISRVVEGSSTQH